MNCCPVLSFSSYGMNSITYQPKFVCMTVFDKFECKFLVSAYIFQTTLWYFVTFRTIKRCRIFDKKFISYIKTDLRQKPHHQKKEITYINAAWTLQQIWFSIFFLSTRCFKYLTKNEQKEENHSTEIIASADIIITPLVIRPLGSANPFQIGFLSDRFHQDRCDKAILFLIYLHLEAFKLWSHLKCSYATIFLRFFVNNSYH